MSCGVPKQTQEDEVGSGWGRQKGKAGMGRLVCHGSALREGGEEEGEV